MVQYLKSILLGLFILTVAFSYSIYFVAQMAFDLPTEGSLFQIYSAVLAFFVFGLFLINFNKIPSKSKNNAIITVVVVVALFYITRFFYNGYNDRYQTYFLSTGVRFVPAVLAGVLILKDDRALKSVEKALLPFVIFYTYILAKYILNVEVGVNMADTFNIEGGMNYQNMAYYSVFAFGLTLYTLTYSKYSRVISYLVIVMAFLQFTLAIMAGSRGAFVLALVFIFYFGAKNFSMKTILRYFVIGALTFYIGRYLLLNNELLGQGFNRIFDFFSDSQAIEEDDRWIRWEMAWHAFLNSPIWGNGIGSVFYKVGFYSHNIFTDMLCEGGLILAVFFVSKLKTVYTKSKTLIRMDRKNEIMVVIFLCSFINICFSGYYLSETGIWLSMAYILGTPKIKR